jgi:hypothetical protein
MTSAVPAIGIPYKFIYSRYGSSDAAHQRWRALAGTQSIENDYNITSSTTYGD